MNTATSVAPGAPAPGLRPVIRTSVTPEDYLPGIAALKVVARHWGPPDKYLALEFGQKEGRVLAVYLLESKGGRSVETALNWWERCCSCLQALGDKGRSGASCDAEQECLCRNAAKAILILQSAAG